MTKVKRELKILFCEEEIIRILLTLLIVYFVNEVTVLQGIIESKTSGDVSLQDSLITDDHVYEYTFSDFDKAKRIMQELRRRRTLPDFELDRVEGDLYFNVEKYYRAVGLYKRTLESDSVRLNDDRLMKQLHRMISCYDCLHDEVRKVQYVGRLLKKAEQCGNKAMQSVAIFYVGKMLYHQGNKERGYSYMQRAGGLMAKTEYPYRFDYLRYFYNTLLVFQEIDRQNKEALHTLEALRKVVVEDSGSEAFVSGLDENEKKAMYAHYAVVLYRLGREREAEDYYRQFLSVAGGYDRDNYLIMPYLFDRQMYDEVIRMNVAREKTILKQGDSVTYHMTTIKRSLGKAYEEKGDYRTAARYFRELAVLRDSIKNREQQSAALELATLYETQEKDRIIHQQESDARMRNLWLGLVVCVASFLGNILWFSIRYNRKIERKNEALVANIEKLLVYKDRLYRCKEEKYLLQVELRKLKKEFDAVVQSSKEQEFADRAEDASEQQTTHVTPTLATDAWIQHSEQPTTDGATDPKCMTDSFDQQAEQPEVPPEEDQQARVEEPDDCSEPDSDTGDERYSKELFEEMEYEIISGKLYLDPRFSAEKMRKMFCISRNNFAPFVRRYTGMRFAKYVNNFRLEHAARLLLEVPEYSIETIAQECGIPALTSFHRLFLERFGITPMEFRKRRRQVE